MTDHEPLRTSLRRPPRLRRGDRVALLTACSPSNLERLDEGIDVLRFAGSSRSSVRIARGPGHGQPYLAGTDAERAADLRAALLDDSIAGVLTVVRRVRLAADARGHGLDRSRRRRAQGGRRVLRRDRPARGAGEPARLDLA